VQQKILILFLGLIIPIANTKAGNDIHIADAWISEAPPTVRVVAGYMTIKNSSSDNIELLNVDSALFKRTELHLSYIENGIAKMRKQESLTIPAKSEITLAPGSYHLMLFDSNQPLKTGDQVPIELTLSNGDSLLVNAEVKRVDMHQQHSYH
jgi:copper(I)-binding protein